MATQVSKVCGNSDYQTIEALPLGKRRSIPKRNQNVNIRLSVELACIRLDLARERFVNLITLPEKRARAADPNSRLATARILLDAGITKGAVGDNLYPYETRVGRDAETHQFYRSGGGYTRIVRQRYGTRKIEEERGKQYQDTACSVSSFPLHAYGT
jgi:hypothetical protein